MDEKPAGIARQKRWKKLIGDELIKSMWFLFSIVAIQTIFYYTSDGDTSPKIPYAVAVGCGLIVGTYRGFYSATRYQTGKFPRGAKAGILSGLIYFTIICGGLLVGQKAIAAGYGLWTCLVNLLSATLVSFIVLYVENDNPKKH